MVLLNPDTNTKNIIKTACSSASSSAWVAGGGWWLCSLIDSFCVLSDDVMVLLVK